jgi:hypothetical protein
MSISLATRLLPSLIRGLVVLDTYLERIKSAAASACADESVYLEAKLADDMFPFRAQIQRATDTAKGAVSRLAGITPLSLPDTESTVEELKVRLAKTIAFIRSVDASEMNGSEHIMFDQRFRGAHYAMLDRDYVDAYVLPNFYFHIAVAHAILRNRHVDVGKADYLGHLSGYAVGRSCPVEGALRFLTAEQSGAWLVAYDLPEDPQDTVPADGAVSFAADVASLRPSAVISTFLDDEALSHSPVMVLLTTWIWDGEYEKDPTAEYRLAQGDSRPLSEVPGWVFPHDRFEDLQSILSMIIERDWNAVVYLPDLQAIVRLIDDARIEVYARESKVADGIRTRLTELGVSCRSNRLTDAVFTNAE